MKETAIIYCRKSTDREDRQTNSLIHQLNNCSNTAKQKNLVVLDTIQESISAKLWWKRSGFNRMIDMCHRWKIDYIVVDEIKRLSRNVQDAALILGLLDNREIKWLYTTDKIFYADDISAKFLLLLEFWISKMDNEQRGADVKGKMMTALENWQWLSQAIFWYRNTWPKWKRDVKVVEKEAKIVVQSFVMRAQQKTLFEIQKYIENTLMFWW